MTNQTEACDREHGKAFPLVRRVRLCFTKTGTHAHRSVGTYNDQKPAHPLPHTMYIITSLDFLFPINNKIPNSPLKEITNIYILLHPSTQNNKLKFYDGT